MSEYRSKDLDLSTNIPIGLEMMHPTQARGRGRASQLADEYGISPSGLYKLKAKAQKAFAAGMRPGRAGRPSEMKAMVIDRNYLGRVVRVIPLLTGSVGSIQTGLELLFGVARSLGYISQTQQAGGMSAQAYNEGMRVPVAVLGEADEFLAGRKPCLTVVDGGSFLVHNLSAADRRDATHWGLTFLELPDQGMAFQDLASDGASGIRAGLGEAQLNAPLSPALFHLMPEPTQLQSRLEEGVYKAIRPVEISQQAEQEARLDLPRFNGHI